MNEVKQCPYCQVEDLRIGGHVGVGHHVPGMEIPEPDIPIYTCNACGQSFTPDKAAEIEEEKRIKKELGI